MRYVQVELELLDGALPLCTIGAQHCQQDDCIPPFIVPAPAAAVRRTLVAVYAVADQLRMICLTYLGLCHLGAELVKTVLPDVWKHLCSDAICFPLSLKSCQWFINLFLGTVPPTTVYNIWDWLLVEGSVALTYVALGLLARCELGCGPQS